MVSNKVAVVISPLPNAVTEEPICDGDEVMGEDPCSQEASGAGSPPKTEDVPAKDSTQLAGRSEPEHAAQEGSQTSPVQARVVVDLTLDSDEANTAVEEAGTHSPGHSSQSPSGSRTKRARHELEDDREDDQDAWRTLKKELEDTILDLRETISKRGHRIDELKDTVRLYKVQRGEDRQISERRRKERDDARRDVTITQRDLEYSKRQCKHIQGELEKTKELLKTRTEELTVAQAFMTTADTFSVADVCLAVEQLNDEIYQCSIMLADMVLRCKEKVSTASSKQLEEARDVVTNAYGQDIVARLQSDLLEGDSVLFESMVQNVLVGRCCAAFQTLCPQNETVDRALKSLREKISQSHEPAIARNWVAMTTGQFRDDQGDPTSTCRFLTELMLIVGWSPEEETSSTEQYPPDLVEKFGEMIQKALNIREMAVEGILSQEIEMFDIQSDATFAPDIMQDAFDIGKRQLRGVEAAPEKILCTTAMGVRRVKRRLPSDSPGPQRTEEVILKPKVLLSSSLSEEQ